MNIIIMGYFHNSTFNQCFLACYAPHTTICGNIDLSSRFDLQFWASARFNVFSENGGWILCLCAYSTFLAMNDRNKKLFTMQALAKFGIWMTLIVYTMYYMYSTRNYGQYAVSSFRWSISWWWNLLCPYRKWQKYRQCVVSSMLNFSYINIVLLLIRLAILSLNLKTITRGSTNLHWVNHFHANANVSIALFILVKNSVSVLSFSFVLMTKFQFFFATRRLQR